VENSLFPCENNTDSLKQKPVFRILKDVHNHSYGYTHTKTAAGKTGRLCTSLSPFCV